MSGPRGRVVAPVLASAVLAGAWTETVASDADTRFAHAPQRDGKYENLVPLRLPTWSELLAWSFEKLRTGEPNPPPGGFASIPVRRPDLSYLNANRRDTTVTWVGHATVLLQLAGINLITDPMFSERASPVDFAGPERKARAPFTIAAGPAIDVVLISHNHYDHLDAPSVDALARRPGGSPLFVVPKGVDEWLKQRGVERVVALDWWDATTLPPGPDGERLRITMVPAMHWSARSPFDRFETLWGGYVVERLAADGAVTWRFYFAGDTGYAPFFRDLIHARFEQIDFAALPIGAYEPRRLMHSQHVSPAEAVRIHLDVAARQSMGIHWGTFPLTTEPFDQPPKDLAVARAAAGVPPEAFVVFEHGETRVLEAKAQSTPATNH